MKRREFLKYGLTTAAIPMMLNGHGMQVLARGLFSPQLYSMHPERKLVLVQLNGGNDGLNTFIPLDQYSNLFKVRQNIIIPENKLLSFNDQIGLHPSMEGVNELFRAEKLLLAQNVGYPEPNLSHFRSKDIITSGSASDVVLRSGWIGRMLNDIHPDYPDGYPNGAYPHPLGLSIGSMASPTCQGFTNNLSSVINNLDTSFQAPGSPSNIPDTPYGHELEFINGVMEQTEVYLEAITEIASKSKNLSTHYPESGNSLADQLRIVARLIAGGLQTQVYVVSLGGWDTHSGQVEEGVPEGGRHGELLLQLSEALYAFQDDLDLLGVADEVIGMVFSEFGRRIKSNDSFGTDHGTAWPAMLFGSRINPVVLGPNPVIPETVEKDTNLSMGIDYRSLYASIFKAWFETPEEAIESVLEGKFSYLPILKQEATAIRESQTATLKAYPNPARDKLKVELLVREGSYDLSLMDESGRQIRKILTGQKLSGKHQIVLQLAELSPGQYILLLQSTTTTVTLPVIRY